MTTTPTSKLKTWQEKLFGKTLNSQGEVVYLDENVQKAWDNFKAETALNKQTPRVSTAPQSLEDARAALDLDIEGRQRHNQVTSDYDSSLEQLRESNKEREVRTRRGHLDSQADAYIKMRQPTLDIQQQIINNRSNVDLPALIALERDKMAQQTALNDQSANDQLIGRLIQGAGMLGLYLS